MKCAGFLNQLMTAGTIARFELFLDEVEPKILFRIHRCVQLRIHLGQIRPH
jgi:hypothetical protein